MRFEITDEDLVNCNRDKELMVIRAVMNVLRALCTQGGEQMKTDLVDCVAKDMFDADPALCEAMMSSYKK